jgi:pimeloyl-ACP methyl ester carboxylesterase
MNDLQWQRDGHAHGVALASSAGYAPAYLHYNSGLSVSTNDRVLAHLMERPVDAWPVPIERLTLLGHSMGGLLAHSALHHGALVSRGSLRWPARVTEMVSLDTPHQGTPLERAGQSVDLPLGAAPYAAPLARIGKIRSAGIRDLRHGEIVLGGKNESETHGRTPASLPDTARCFAIAGCLGPPGRSLKGPLLGDGLVPVASALGQHRDPALRLAFHNERQAVVHETGHLELLSSTKVTAILTRWLA